MYIHRSCRFNRLYILINIISTFSPALAFLHPGPYFLLLAQLLYVYSVFDNVRNIFYCFVDLIFYQSIYIQFLQHKQQLLHGNACSTSKLGLKKSHTEKVCIVSYYIQFSRIIKMYNHNIKTSFDSPCLQALGANKTSFNLIIVHFYIC